MKIESLKEYMTADILMGPNSVRILEELWNKNSMHLKNDDIVLDLGCGKGLTSFAIAKETSVHVYANDLWIPAEENAKRFAAWNVQDLVTPFCENANEMHFEKQLFQGLVSVDAYHYFATDKGFFSDKILPLLKNNAEILIGVPGIKTAYTGRSDELLSEWLGDEAYMFQSPLSWKEIIGDHDRIETVETWEMDCFEDAWNEWFATGHKYALGDKSFYETIIKPYTCFVGIFIKLK